MVEDILERYIAVTSKIENGKNYWNYLKVDIYEIKEKAIEGKQGEHRVHCGSYTRNYSDMYNTFVPFVKDGKDYALYSDNYQSIAIMSLPDCKEIARYDGHFCPVDFYVPDFQSKVMLEYYEAKLQTETKESEKEWLERMIKKYSKDLEFEGKSALVSGCVWGDDSGGWKLMYLDISEMLEGKIDLQARFGYCELGMGTHPMKDYINWEEPGRLYIPLNASFELDLKDEKETGFLGYSFDSLKHYQGKSYQNFKVEKVPKKED